MLYGGRIAWPKPLVRCNGKETGTESILMFSHIQETISPSTNVAAEETYSRAFSGGEGTELLSCDTLRCAPTVEVSVFFLVDVIYQYGSATIYLVSKKYRLFVYLPLQV